MALSLLLQLISSLCLATNMALAVSWSKPGCPEKCGDVTIPYPFGIGSNCSANSWFTIICQSSTNSPTPILSNITMEVLEISLRGLVWVKQPLSSINCSDGRTRRSLPTSLLGSPFTISAVHNIFVNFGCNYAVFLTNGSTLISGCVTTCETGSTDTTCTGVNCCRATLPKGLQELQYTYQSIQASNDSFCRPAFLVENDRFEEKLGKYKGRKNDQLNLFDDDFGFAPVVLEWEFHGLEHSPAMICTGTTTTSAVTARSFCDEVRSLCISYGYPPEFRHLCSYAITSCPSFRYVEYGYHSATKYCYCACGYEGNPYLPGGCKYGDATISKSGTCTYAYEIPAGDGASVGLRMIKIAFTCVGSVFGAIIFFFGAWRSGHAVMKGLKALRKYMFYKHNGGLLLEQQLASIDNGLEKTQLFTSEELEQATDHYNENRILGRGGQGTVYKGMLANGKIVAVKKCKRVNEGEVDVEVFINEIVILSQINHRNVVKLLGCCLETEMPLLVYEFVPNGTLFQHIHEPNEELPLTWEMRVRIAAEVAGTLSYLHSAASAPVYHRDIKSTNILLDEKYRAKVSDFGTSRTIAIDQTHLTTKVQGTFGYLDPEYFRSNQFTEKSDVYSFGVVMVELLTGEQAVSSVRTEAGKNLAMHFLDTMEENHLFDILDARVLQEGRREEIVATAELARRCLHLTGRGRPTMKDVAVDLEGIQRAMRGGMVSLPNNYNDNDNQSIERFESSHFSLIFGSVHMDTTSACSPDDESPLPDEP